MNTCQYTLSVEIPYGLTIVSSPNYDHDYRFKLGITMISGKEVVYHVSGYKLIEWNFRNSKLNGLEIFWYENGNKRSESNYKNGMLDGISTMWYDNGKVRYECSYKDGKKEGLSRGWYKNGNLSYERRYHGGELHRYLYWSEDGKCEEFNHEDSE